MMSSRPLPKHKVNLTVVLVLVLSLCLAACGGGSGGGQAGDPGTGTEPGTAGPAAPDSTAGAGEPSRGGRIVIARTDPPDTLDPHKTGRASASAVMSLLGGALLAVHPDDLSLQPGLARDWEVSEDGLEYTFYLRDDVKWHTGDPLTAHDFKYTFERALDPATQASVAADFIRGIEEITVDDDHTLRIRIAEPSAIFARNLASSSYMMPLLRSAVEAAGDNYGREPVGVGPYVFDDWVTGYSIRLKRNEDFAWGHPWFDNQGAPYPDELEYRYFGDDATMLAALEAGEIDIAPLAPHEVERFRNDDRFTVLSSLQNGLGRFFIFNLKLPKFQDVRVRQAIAHGIDKAFFVERSLEGLGQPAYSMIPPTLPGYWEGAESAAPAYDPQRALDLLAEAGWEQGADGYVQQNGERLVINVLTSSDDRQNRDAELFKQMMAGIGIDVQIESVEAGLWGQRLQDGDYDMAPLQYWYSDPDVLFFFFHSDQHPNGLNYGGVNDPELNALLEEGRRIADDGERMKIYHEAQRLLNEQVYAIPVYVPESFTAINSRIKGIRVNKLGELLFHDAWVAP